ncbi:MAG: hypothetical protein WBA74_18540 [Cyclobacteriaceae bacterium]
MSEKFKTTTINFNGEDQPSTTSPGFRLAESLESDSAANPKAKGYGTNSALRNLRHPSVLFLNSLIALTVTLDGGGFFLEQIRTSYIMI